MSECCHDLFAERAVQLASFRAQNKEMLKALKAAEVLRQHEIANDADHWCEFDFDQGVMVDYLRKEALADIDTSPEEE